MPDQPQLDTRGRQPAPEWSPPAGWNAPLPGAGEAADEWGPASWRIDTVAPGCRALAERSRTWLQELGARTRELESRARELENRLETSESVGGKPAPQGANPRPPET